MDKAKHDGLKQALAKKENLSARGQADGYAALDAQGRVPDGQLSPLMSRVADTQRYRNLVIQPHADTPSHEVSLTADMLSVEGWRFEGVELKADLHVSGAGGLDTGSKQASTWYHLWVIADLRNPSNPRIAALFSLQYPGSGTQPTLPGSYTKKQYYGAVYVQSNGEIRSFWQRNVLHIHEDKKYIATLRYAPKLEQLVFPSITSPNARSALFSVTANKALNSPKRVSYLSSSADGKYQSLRIFSPSTNAHYDQRMIAYWIELPDAQSIYFSGYGDVTITSFSMEI